MIRSVRPHVWLFGAVLAIGLPPTHAARGETPSPVVRRSGGGVEKPVVEKPVHVHPLDDVRPCDFPRTAIPAPLGTYVRQWQGAMVGQALRMNLLVSRHFWYQGGDQLGPEAVPLGLRPERHVGRIAAWLVECPEHVVVEAEEVRIDQGQSLADARARTLRLDERRRQVVVAELARRGVLDAERWVIVQPVDRVGVHGVESPLIYGRLLMGGGGGRGMGGGGALGGGLGGGAGGMGGGLGGGTGGGFGGGGFF